jgi:branched-chain amino acid transport system permease protein
MKHLTLRLAPVLLWGLALSAFWLLPRELPLLTHIVIMGLFALSLDLILGYAGIVSLGHAAFFGIGAYAAGLLGRHGWGEPLSGLLISGGLAGLAGLLTAPLILRGSDLTRLMITLGLAALLQEAANKAAAITGGSDGLSDIVINPLLGRWAFDLYGTTAYAYALGVLFVLWHLARRIMASPFGLSLRGIRENPLRMRALGSPVDQRLIAVHGLAAAYAGMAGALLTQTTQFVSLDVLSFHRSAEALLMLVLGGAGWLYGGLIGAGVLLTAQKLLSDLTPQYWQFWTGAALIALVLFARGGLIGLSMALLHRLKRP